MQALRTEIALWNSARNGHVTPLVVLSRLAPLTLLIGAVLKAISGPMPSQKFTLLSLAALQPMLVAAVVPTVLFAVLDRRNFLNATAWKFAGAVQKFDFSTSERERHGALVLFPMGTYSSNALTAMGGLILAHACSGNVRVELASFVLGASFLVMGIASFGWWASRRYFFHRFDNWMMETHLSSVAVAVIAASVPEHEHMLVAAWACRALWRLFTFGGHADLLVPSVATWAGVLFSILRTGGSGEVWRNVVGIGGVHCGLVLKMYDTTGRGAWGTAAFHYSTAIGWALFWSWSQTLPLAPTL